MRTIPLPTVTLQRRPTESELEKLEKAIYNHGYPIKEMYHDILWMLRDNLDDDLNNMRVVTRRALRHCWMHLSWRPSENNQIVELQNP